jgi:amidase
MARTVKDAVILLGALTGIDPNDAITRQSEGKAKTDYTPFLDAGGLKGKRLGVETAFLKGHEGLVGLYKQAIDELKKQGAEIVELELVKKINPLGPSEFLVLQYEFKDGLNKYLSASNSPVKSLEAVIAFNKQNEPKAMPFFKQETLESSQALGGLDSKPYLDALKKSTGARGIIDGLLKQHKLDALVSVTNGVACCIDLINGDYDTGFSTSSPAAMAGYPHITVPMGLVHGLPIGLSFFGTAYTEPALISMAYAYEQATKKRVAPGFIPNSNL